MFGVLALCLVHILPLLLPRLHFLENALNMASLPLQAWHFALALIRQFRRRLNLILKVSVPILAFYLIEIAYHAQSYDVPRPPQDLDGPFSTQCQDPLLAASQPRENATFVMLARNSEIDKARDTINNIERQFNQWFHYPVIFLNNEEWDPEFVRVLNKSVSGQASFHVIPDKDWSYPEGFDIERAKQSMAMQSQTKVWNGGKESYHHMCRFYSGYVSTWARE